MSNYIEIRQALEKELSGLSKKHDFYAKKIKHNPANVMDTISEMQKTEHTWYPLRQACKSLARAIIEVATADEKPTYESRFRNIAHKNMSLGVFDDRVEDAYEKALKYARALDLESVQLEDLLSPKVCDTFKRVSSLIDLEKKRLNASKKAQGVIDISKLTNEPARRVMIYESMLVRLETIRHDYLSDFCDQGDCDKYFADGMDRFIDSINQVSRIASAAQRGSEGSLVMRQSLTLANKIKNNFVEFEHDRTATPEPS